MIDAQWDCLECGRPVHAENLTPGSESSCECGWKAVVPPAAIVDGRMERCPWCGTEDLYVQKDFPHRIGILLVVTAVVLATIAWANYSWIGTIGTLVFFFGVDFLLFHTRPNVTVCYRCLSQFRGAGEHPTRRAFDLAIGERYRQERLRKESLRRQPTTAGRPLTTPRQG